MRTDTRAHPPSILLTLKPPEVSFEVGHGWRGIASQGEGGKVAAPSLEQGERKESSGDTHHAHNSTTVVDGKLQGSDGRVKMSVVRQRE
jgi:hypothetical protein